MAMDDWLPWPVNIYNPYGYHDLELSLELAGTHVSTMVWQALQDRLLAAAAVSNAVWSMHAPSVPASAPCTCVTELISACVDADRATLGLSIYISHYTMPTWGQHCTSIALVPRPHTPIQ